MTKSQKERVSSIILFVVLTLGAILILFPIAWMICTALKSAPEIAMYPPKLLPEKPMFENFIIAWGKAPFTKYTINTLIIVFFSIIGHVFVNSFVSYGFAKVDFAGKNILFTCILATMMIPGIVCQIPMFVVYVSIGWYNTLTPLIVPAILGGGGHAYEVCKRLGSGRLIGIDQDGDAIRAASERLTPFADKVSIVRSNYENIEEVLADLHIDKVDGIYLDLGVSSYQLDTPSRGFSYREDAPLDMRMDDRQDRTAADIVNTYDEGELYRIIRDYGEDRFAKNIAKHIVRAREEKPIETTGELAELIKAAIPAKVRATGGHPAKRTFQAIRIELNRELDVLEHSIDAMIRLLAPEGRLSIITFHSLEDRIVKASFRRNEAPCICPPDFPVCVCGRVSMGKVITRKPILPSQKELEENSRAASAKLRVFERAAAGEDQAAEEAASAE